VKEWKDDFKSAYMPADDESCNLIALS